MTMIPMFLSKVIARGFTFGGMGGAGSEGPAVACAFEVMVLSHFLLSNKCGRRGPFPPYCGPLVTRDARREVHTPS